MVKENRIVFSLDEITRIRFQCECGVEVVQEAETVVGSPRNCPTCDRPWVSGEWDGVNYKLVKAIRAVLNNADPLPMTLRFEMDATVGEYQS